MPELFDRLTQRSVTFRNRIGISPMCEYSADDGLPNDWHFVHLGSRAVGGAGLVITEATAVEPEGRISPGDTGIWNDAQTDAWARIVGFMEQHGAVPGIQLAHAGRKASVSRPWEGDVGISPEQGGWQTVAPSAKPFSEKLTMPRALSHEEIGGLTAKFVEATRRSLAAGFKVIELHAAHGYLFHEFLSPMSNERQDTYGGSFDNRVRFLLETAISVRAVLPERLPLWVRISCTDWVDGGWTIEESVELARRLKLEGVDCIDCSSGGNVPHVRIPVGPGYQVPFSARIKREANIQTAAVGMITQSEQANHIIKSGDADMTLIARQALVDPYWPLHAAKELGKTDALKPPVQYARAL